MRTILSVCFFLMCATLSWGQSSALGACSLASNNQDRYALESMKRALDKAEDSGFFSMLDAPVMNQGDGMSVAMLKIVPEEDLATPKFVKSYLSLVRTAFSRTDLILCSEDKRPSVTLFLLDYLHEHVNDKDLVTRIESAREYVVKQTASFER